MDVEQIVNLQKTTKQSATHTAATVNEGRSEIRSRARMSPLKLALTLISVLCLTVAFAGCGGSSGGSNPADFTLDLAPSNLAVEQGTQGTANITVKPQNGFSGSVNFELTGSLPSGVTVAFAPNPSSSTSVMTVTASATATTGRNQLTLVGTSGSVTSTTGFSLNITAGTGLPATTTSLSSSLNPSFYGQPVTFTAAVTSSGNPLPSSANGEIITFSQAKNKLGTGTLNNGSATFTTSTLTTGGTDNIVALYSGDANYAASTSNTVEQVVQPEPTTLTLTSSPNPSNQGQVVTFTGTVVPQYGGSPTGSVSFLRNGVKEGLGQLANGVATYVTAGVPVGSSTYTAVYNNTGPFNTSTSGPITQTVGTGTFIDVCQSGSNSVTTWSCLTSYSDNGLYTDRAFEVFVPTALPPNPAVVIMLHGTQIDNTQNDPLPVIQLDWGWSSVANFYGFVVVKPASTYDTAGSNQWNWNAYCMDGTALCAPYGSNEGAFDYPQAQADCGSDGECPDDIGFLRSLIGSLLANQGSQYGNFKLNPKMVYVTGFSSGAQMTERVGVELSDLVAAIIPASGPLYNCQTGGPTSCNPLSLPLPGNAKAPISVQEWGGTDDIELPPCNGQANAGTNGTTNYSGVIFTLDTVDDTFNYWTGPQANNFTSQNSVFQTTSTLCTAVTQSNPIGTNIANDATTPLYPSFPVPTGYAGNIAVSTGPPSAITAATESTTPPGTTVTITSTLNPGVGGVAFITGMAPSEYNGTWIVTASTPTSFQYINTTAGLADATAFGTVQGGQGTEVQYIWEQGLQHSYNEAYDTWRWLFFASHPKP